MIYTKIRKNTCFLQAESSTAVDASFTDNESMEVGEISERFSFYFHVFYSSVSRGWGGDAPPAPLDDQGAPNLLKWIEKFRR